MIDISDNVQCVTLECLMNPLQYDKYMQTQTHTAAAHSKEKDRCFYRRRIVQMTKELSRGSLPTKALQYAYQSYADGLVEHFKAMDTQDILQMTYEGMGRDRPPDIRPMDKARQEQSDVAMLSAPQTRLDGAAAMERFVVRERTPDAPTTAPTVRKVTLDSAPLRNKGVPTTGKGKKKI